MKRYGKHLVLGVGIVGVGALLLGWNVAMWMQDYLEGINSDIARMQMELRSATEEIGQNQMYQQKWAAISGFREELVVERKNKFERHLQSLGPQFVSQSIPTGEPITGNPEFQELSYVFNFDTDLGDLTEFLEKLDHSEELLRITRLVMKKNSQSRPVSRSTFPRTLGPVRSGALDVTIRVSLPAAQEATEINPEARRNP